MVEGIDEGNKSKKLEGRCGGLTYQPAGAISSVRGIRGRSRLRS